MKAVPGGLRGRQVVGLTVAFALLVLLGAVGAGAQKNHATIPERGRVIELVICLDASASMDGLIDAAKQKLWAIVNDLALANPAPELRVAVLSYGNNEYESADGWVALQTPFTNDLDLVSERLFAVETSGGTEYVGRVLQVAGSLPWSPSTDAMQLIVVAGNESADQDPSVDFRAQSRELSTRGIVVNAVYCGAAEDGLVPAWQEIAQQGAGTFASIDHNDGTVVIATPFDDQLGTLSSELNLTYLPFGVSGQAGAANQSKQDANAAGMNTAAKAARAVAKSSSIYNCSWDLVDACKAGAVNVAELDREDLPDAMRALSIEERQEYIDNMARKRAAIQTKINSLNASRVAFIENEMKQKALDDSRAFDTVIRRAIRAQAETEGFHFRDALAESGPTRSSNASATAVQVQFQPTEPRPEPTLGSLTTAEQRILRGIFARAASVRHGKPADETQVVDSQVRITPDIVVYVGTEDDLNLLKTAFPLGAGSRVTTSGGTVLHVDGQAILFAEGC